MIDKNKKYFLVSILLTVFLLAFLSCLIYITEPTKGGKAQPVSGKLKAKKGSFLTEADLLNSRPPGQFANLKPKDYRRNSFSGQDPLISTYYYYWYDYKSKNHFFDSDKSDALTTHPVNPESYSWKKTSWHLRQLRDMEDAGIDIVLPVYWGEPTVKLKKESDFSNEGLLHLALAYEILKKQGYHPPQIGMFYDTTTLEYTGAKKRVDLSTPEGKAWFYVTIRDFFSQVPPEAWAKINNRPIVFLYMSGFALNNDDPGLFPYVADQFRRDFDNTRPYIVSEVSWKQPTESKYAWGSAFGLKLNSTATLGPGYDDGAVQGRTRQRVDREDGAFYSRNWEKLLALDPKARPKMVGLETWNEFHEGSDIAETKEYGRQYINLTRKYADLWKKGIQLK